MSVTFHDFNLSPDTLAAIDAKGFVTPTPIQAATIPKLLAGCHDLIGQARTGTGKTAAFGLPIIEKIDFERPEVQALILAPTRELAQQIAVELQSLSKGKELKVACVYGGQSIEPQIRAIRNGAQIVVGTPGRVIDHLNRKTLKASAIQIVVLDEADEMLAMGFVDDLEVILEYLPEDRQMLMFSATMPKRIQKLAETFMNGYELIKTIDAETKSVALVEQIAHIVSPKQRPAALKRIIDATDKFYGVVFCKTRAEVDEVGARLAEEGNRAEIIHGDVSQPQREKIMAQFKARKVHVLVATDVAARGLDISGLTHVVNYSLPQNSEIYVHRVGRTGRAGKEGIAITLITAREKRFLGEFERATGGKVTVHPLPTGETIIQKNAELIQKNITSIIESEKHQKFYELAEGLLANGEAKDIIAAFLKYSFSSKLDLTNFDDLNDSAANSTRTRDGSDDNFERSGRSSRSSEKRQRLFVFKGEKDNMTTRSLIQLFTDDLPLDPNDIQEVTIRDAFSFITVSPENAELILNAFGSKDGERGFVEKAADKKDKRDDDSFGGDRRDSGRRRSSSEQSSRRPRESSSRGRDFSPSSSRGEGRERSFERNFDRSGSSERRSSGGERSSGSRSGGERSSGSRSSGERSSGSRSGGERSSGSRSSSERSSGSADRERRPPRRERPF